MSWRTEAMAFGHMVSAGHELAALAAFEILENGGNAVDAGVAGGIALGVVQSDLVNVAGVAPIMIRMAGARAPVSIAGLGVWPSALDPNLFVREHGGRIPQGILRTVVPAAPAAWIKALELHGTMGFAAVAAPAIRLAREGFPMHPLMAALIAEHAADYARYPASAAIYLPGGRPPAVGDRFVQAELADTLQYMADEAARGRDRHDGLARARAAFYRGDIAHAIVRFHETEGGLLRERDFAEYEVEVETPPAVDYRGGRLWVSGPWSQGTSLAQVVNLLQAFDWTGVEHNGAEHLHRVVECIKIAFADRDALVGDPNVVDVPLARLLDPAYARERLRAVYRERRAHPDMPRPPGAPTEAPRATGGDTPPGDTSYLAVVDRHGNAFSATPSDVSYSSPVVPGTGLVPSARGSASWADPAHPCAAAPGKRPRLTPNPAIWQTPDGGAMPFGTPGGDVQVQAMAQFLLNLHVFGLRPQEAVERARGATYSFPGTFEPHTMHPARINLEAELAERVGAELAARGHDVVAWPERTYLAGAVCAVVPGADGLLIGAADPRRPTLAVGR